MSSKSRIFAAVAAVVIVAAVLVGGFIVNVQSSTVTYPLVPATSTTENTFSTSSLFGVASTTEQTFATSTVVDVVSTSEQTFATSSTTSVPVTQSTTATQDVFDESDISLKATYYDSYSVSFSVGTDVQVSWQASEKVNIYFFNSAEFSAYASSGTTSPNIASDSASSGTLDFVIAGNDTYYMVVENPNDGILGLGASNVGYTTTGTETYPTTSTTYITQTVTYDTSTPTAVTSTSTVIYTTSTPTVVTSTTTAIYTTSTPSVVTYTTTSTSTVTCSHGFWYWLFGANSCT